MLERVQASGKGCSSNEFLRPGARFCVIGVPHAGAPGQRQRHGLVYEVELAHQRVPHAHDLTDRPAQLTSCRAHNRRNSSCFSDNARISEESCTSSGLLPTFIRRTPTTVAAMRAGSANRSHASGERKIYRATFRSPGGSRAQSPKTMVASRFHPRMSRRRLTKKAGTPSVPRRCWAVG
jgi:hypothetical protein